MNYILARTRLNSNDFYATGSYIFKLMDSGHYRGFGYRLKGQPKWFFKDEINDNHGYIDVPRDRIPDHGNNSEYETLEELMGDNFDLFL